MKIAVVSGKGGSGKSSVSAAFIALSSRVVAVDCDVDASNLPLLFRPEIVAHERFASGEDIVVNEELCIGCGRCVDSCAFHALKIGDDHKAYSLDYQCEGCGLCVRLCPQQALSLVQKENSDIYTSHFSQGILVHGRLCPGDDNSGKMIARMRACADQCMEEQQIDLQILDGPPGIGCPVLSTLTGVDRVVIVCEPSLSGYHDLQRIYQVASSYCQQLYVIINKSDINPENALRIADFCRELEIPVVAEIPFDKRMVESVIHCEPIVTYAPDSLCTQNLVAAYRYILQVS